MENNYINIIRLFDHCNIDVERLPIETSRALKIIKAEFAASPNGLLTIGDYVYTMQGVVKLFEQPNFEQIIIWEKEIYENEYLIQFLENKSGQFINEESFGKSRSVSINYGSNILWSGIYKLVNINKSDKFIDYYSLYFATGINIFIKRSLALSKHNETDRVFLLLDTIKPEHREIALESLRKFLLYSITIIRNTNEVTLPNSLKSLDHFGNIGWAAYFNNIPNDLYPLKLGMVKALINLMALNNSKSWPKELVVISKQLSSLKNLDPSLENLIKENHSIIGQYLYRKFVIRVIVAVIIAEILIFSQAL